LTALVMCSNRAASASVGVAVRSVAVSSLVVRDISNGSSEENVGSRLVCGEDAKLLASSSESGISMTGFCEALPRRGDVLRFDGEAGLRLEGEGLRGEDSRLSFRGRPGPRLEGESVADEESKLSFRVRPGRRLGVTGGWAEGGGS